MPLDVHVDAALYVTLVFVALVLLSSLAGILSFYLGLIPVSILRIGVGLPLYGLFRLLQVMCRSTRDCRRPVDIIVGLTQCALSLSLGGTLIAHQLPRALSPHAHEAASTFAEMPIVQLCLGCGCLIGVAATGIGVVVSGRAFVARLARHLLAEA
jgi:hypothetical protein